MKTTLKLIICERWRKKADEKSTSKWKKFYSIDPLIVLSWGETGAQKTNIWNKNNNLLFSQQWPVIGLSFAKTWAQKKNKKIKLKLTLLKCPFTWALKEKSWTKKSTSKWKLRTETGSERTPEMELLYFGPPFSAKTASEIDKEQHFRQRFWNFFDDQLLRNVDRNSILLLSI